MKTLSFLLMFLPVLVFGQTQPENYIRTIAYNVATKDGNVQPDDKTEEITYYDGLGRTSQKILVRAGADNEDIITPYVYDLSGKMSKNYLPYGSSTTQNGQIYPNSVYENLSFYDTEKYEETVNPYSEIIYERSPLTRVLEEASPGNAWKYDSNNVSFESASRERIEWNDLIVPLTLDDVCVSNEGNGRGFIKIEDNVLYLEFTGQLTPENDIKLGSIKYINSSPASLPDTELGEIVRIRQSFNKLTVNGRIKDNFLEFYLTENQGSIDLDFLNINLSIELPAIKEQREYQRRVSRNNTIRYQHEFNKNNEVALFEVDFINGDKEKPQLLKNDYYHIDQLSKKITYNENWQPDQTFDKDNSVETFTDKKGRIILKRAYNNNIPHDTYFVYDKYDNLSFVIPPKVSVEDGVSQTELSTLCYQYCYDYKHRLIKKKVPGKGWYYMIYDALDRLVMTQDSKQRNSSPKQWLFTKYDQFGRIAYTGMLKNNESRENIQEEFNTISIWPIFSETKIDDQEIVQGTTIYYTNEADPFHIDEIYTISYYDNYTFDTTGAINPITVYGTNVTTNAKTLPTGTKVRVLGTNKWITTVNYYDEKAQLIYKYTYNEYLGTTNTVSNKLNFMGKVLESTTRHQRNGGVIITTIDKFTYDHKGRLLTHIQRINDQEEELIVCNTYDELGVLVKKSVGGTSEVLEEQNYTDLINVSVSDAGEISKNSTDNSWSAGIATVKSIIGDGAVSFIPQQSNKAVMVGLSYSNANTTLYNAIDFAIYAKSNGTIGVFEKGKNLGEYGSYTTTDTLSVQREGTQIRYQKNGVTVYTSTVASTGAMIGDVSLYHSDTAIKDLDVTGDLKKGLQTIDYAYNVRGWLKQINNPHETLGDDLFAFGVNYETTSNNAQALYDGNISQTFWKTSNDGIKRRYDYSYDALNRITAGVHIYGQYNLSDVKYDKNGNILNLTRTGWQNGVSYANMDRLTYQYDAGNQLVKVTDTGNDQYGFIDGTNSHEDYVYDVNGNMILDHNKGITNIRYDNHLNLPTQVAINGKQINHVYDATGVKQSKSFDSIVTLYDNGYIYENGELQFFAQPEGYIQPGNGGNFEYIYQYKDHLDNVRLSYRDADKDGVINPNETIEESNYYPFGLQHRGYNNVTSSQGNSAAQKFKYNGKEFNEELGFNMYDYGARFYDPATARWFSIDALAEKYYDQSTYAYTINNPIIYIDPDGNQVEICCQGLKDFFSGFGTTLVNIAEGSQLHNQLIGQAQVTISATKSLINGDTEQAGNTLLESTGIPSAVRTIEGAANGNLKDIGSISATVVMYAATKKLAGKGNVPKNKNLAQVLADRAQKLSSNKRPNTVAVIETTEGRIVAGRNKGQVTNSKTQAQVEKAGVNEFCGQCAEINAIARARNKGYSVRNAKISVANVRGKNSTSGVHGTNKKPCSTCAGVLKQNNIKVIK